MRAVTGAGRSFVAIALVCAWGCAGSGSPSEPPAPEGVRARGGPRLAPAARHVEATQRAIAALPKDALLRSKRGLPRIPAGDGVTKLHLGGRFQHATVIVRDANGQTSTSCIDGVSAGDRADGASSTDDE